VKNKSLKKVNVLLALALTGSGAYASTADQELLDILLKNGSINKTQYSSMLGKEGMASSQLLEILTKNGTITKDQYTGLTKKNPSLAATPAPVATLKTASTGTDGTHVTFGHNGGLEIFSNVKEKDKDGNEMEAPKKGPDGRSVNADGKAIVDEAGKPVLDKDGKPLKPAYTKEFSLKLGGRIQADSQINWNDEKGPYGTDLSNGVGFRRARIYTEGVMFKDYEFRFEYDFARNNGGTQGITDAYLKYIRFPNYAITIGQQNEGKSMESVMSNNYLTFIERSLPNNAFIEQGANSKYQLGATAETWNKIAWSNDKDHPWDTPYTVRGGITTEAFGAPGPGNSSANSQGAYNVTGGNNSNGTNTNRNAFSGDTSYQVVGRATFAPVYQKDVGLLHTGVWGSWRSVNNNYNADGSVRTGGWAYQSQPDSVIDRTNWINTGNLTNTVCLKTTSGVCTNFGKNHEVNNVAMFGAELAGSYGPVHLESEYMQAQIAGKGYSGSDTLQGFYVQGGWFLTGESRPYDVKRGTWDRLVPNKSFIGSDGWGAFEVAYRYDLMDMNTLHINAGSINAGTLGLNWYLTPRIRFMTNWVHVFATNNGSAAASLTPNAATACSPKGNASPAQQSGNAAIGCFNGLSPDIWEMAVRLDY